MKIILYIMNEKGKKVLERLCEYFDPMKITAVISSRDPNVKNDYYDDIQLICSHYKIKFLDRHEDTSIYDNDYRLAVGWRWIIPSTEKLIIFHDSMLPKYRGFAPLVNALINGESSIGVTALFASSEYDRGNIIAQEHVSITYPITINEAINKITPIYQSLAIKVVQAIQARKLNGMPQNELNATYSIWRDKEDYLIDWNISANKIVRFINAVGYPYAGAYSWINNRKVIILEATIADNVKLEQRHVGKVLFFDGTSPIIIAGKGLVKLKKLTDIDGNSLLPLKHFRTRFK